MEEIPEREQEARALKDDTVSAKQNLKGDWLNVFLLLLLYTMQGLPLGMTNSLSFVLQSKGNITYQDQTLFSFSQWPFSLKLLWAPLVDAIYVQKLGRRKSWLIPVQYLLGATLIYAATEIDDLLPETGKANVAVLTFVFFVVNLLAAIQDVVVDGWALTILKKNNVGYASTCNSVGQTSGMLIGSVVPILFTSENFSNKYLRSTPDIGGIVTMKCLLYGMGALFGLVTTLVAIFKKEKDYSLEDDHVKLNIFQTYTLMWDILNLSSVKILVTILLTMKIGIGTTDVTALKLIDAGVSKENITIINTVLIGINIIITIITSKYTTGPKSITIMLESYRFRIFLNVLFAILVFYTPQWIMSNGIVDIPINYYATYIFLSTIQHILFYAMFVSLMAFFSQKSDPRFGGTYMTLLNTFANIGTTLANTISFGMIDILTFKRSSFDPENELPTLNCQKENKGDCTVDGYFIEVALFTVYGIVWYVVFIKYIKELQARGISSWLVKVNRTTTAENYSLPMT